MKSVLNFFKNRIVISVLGLILLSVIIWFVGPMIKFGDDNVAPLAGETTRLLIIMALLLLWGLNNLFMQLRNKKQNDDLVDDLQQDQAEGQNNLLSEQTSEEMHQINERFSQALGTLKRLRFKKRGFKTALYELPWYIIIGPPGSGKTTALINSTLDFPLADRFGKGALQGVGGTRNCDWWFTNEAVLIDTAGRYTTQDSHRVIDSSAWGGFLQLLKRHRRRRPINGVIIAISIQELLTQTEDERLKHTRTIRARIDELMEKLEVRFPIYLMFTKCDLVSGFTEFFEDFNKEDREQVWGLSLPNAPNPSDAPDFDYLEEEFDQLLKRLYDGVLWRVHQERDGKRRALIQGFPQQMENLKPAIQDFVQKTFLKNRYQFQPYLRGIYFSSGTQDGTPVDRLMSSVSANFGFANEGASLGYQQGKSYFLGTLFRSVIFPEAELVGANRRYERMIKWGQRAAYVGLASVATIAILTWLGGITRHEMYMSEVQAAIDDYQAGSRAMNRWSSDLRAALPSLNALHKASVVYDKEAHPWMSSLGMYDPNVDEAADRAYRAKLKELYQPQLLAYVEKHLRQLGRDESQGAQLYNAFRTYVMFDKLEHFDKAVVRDWFHEAWRNDFQGRETQRAQLHRHLDNLLALERESAELDPQLRARTQRRLLQVPAARRIYTRIRSKPEYAQQIDLANQFGEPFKQAYVVNEGVRNRLALPILFTKQAYDRVDFSPDSKVISQVANERWLLDDDGNARANAVDADIEHISKKVKAQYLAEYSSHWRGIYGSLEIQDFKNLRHANEVLSLLADPVYSPLRQVLQIGSDNTRLSYSVPTEVAEAEQSGVKGKVSGMLASKVPRTVVDKEFSAVNALMRESERSPAPISSVIMKVGQLQEFVGGITMAPNPSQKAYKIAKARYLNGAGNAITSLAAYAKSSPQPVRRWLTKIADQSWKVVLQSAHGHVRSEWRNAVYRPYQSAIAGRYPVDANADNELAVLDFVDFFKPGGTIDTFYNEYVAPFIDTRRGWANRGVDNYSLGLSRNTLRQIRTALKIQKTYFTENPEAPSMSFAVRPRRLSKHDARLLLEMGPDRLTYSHGPRFWSKLRWSGSSDASRLRVLFEGVDGGQFSKTYEGPWAWFRFLDHARVEKTTQSNVFLVSYGLTREQGGRNGYDDEAHRISLEIKTKSVRNRLDKDLISSFRCPERI